jgi:hypothetical protein
MIFRNFTPILLALFAGLLASAQNTGDTLVYKAFNYNSTTRDTVIQLPTNPNLTYEKILMLYSMRCKDGLVSSSSNRNRGCGEWDYSNNTYITDSSHVDSLAATQAKYLFGGYTGSVFNYTAQPTYKFYQTIQPNTTVNSIITEDTADLGAGNTGVPMPIATAAKAAKVQMLYTQSELLAAGLAAGNINALAVYMQAPTAQANMMRIRIKATTDTALNPANPHLNGFTEVYYRNTALTFGANRLQFYTPFVWNGTANLIVEFTHTNTTATPAVSFQGDSVSPNITAASIDQATFTFSGSNYIQANNYNGIGGNSPRTIEAWIKTTSHTQDIMYWGSNVNAGKYRFWVNPAGQLRLEINNGSIVGTTAVNDGQWHHVAMVQYGTTTNQIYFYIDGVLDPISTSANLTINTGTTTPLQITKGIHNTYWKGNISEVRLWSTALTAATINDWRNRRIEPTHPNYAALEIYYPLNENAGTSITDKSGKNRNATAINGALWQANNGINLFKHWASDWHRPKTTFYQGTYNLTTTNITLVDTVVNQSNYIAEYAIYPKKGTIYADSIGTVSTGYYWQAGNDSLFAPDSTLISTTAVQAAGSFTQINLPYWRRFPAKFELVSFVTPYGIGLDLGMAGKTWTFDVTDFTPVLNGKKRINMEWGGQWQEDMDVKFLFIVGTPPADVIDIQNIWRVSKEGYSRIVNDLAFEPKNITLNTAANTFKVRTAITGHGQEGEFIPRTHWFKLNGTNINSWQVWKECALNPVYPQGGTWIYDRAGWCPGMATDVRETNLNSVTPGQNVQLDYGLTTATGTSEYIVSNQLISYGAPNFTLDAAVVDIINPTDKIEYARTGSMCNGPVVHIRNTGSTVLTTLVIKYWVNSTAAPELYNWSGALAFGEVDEVNLPVAGLWNNLNGTPNNTFHVEVSQPNGGADAYSYNNHMYSTFKLPMVIPNKFFFGYKSNLAPQETSYKVLNDQGAVVFNRSGGTANTVYVDTLTLPDGCYTLQIDDTGDDGISFWANNDGNGYFRIFNGNSNALITTLQGDFGKAITLPFTVNSPLSFEELQQKIDCRVYPNPSSGQFTIEAHSKKPQDWLLTFVDVQGKMVWSETVNNQQNLELTQDFSHLPAGIYFLRTQAEGASTVQKVVIR